MTKAIEILLQFGITFAAYAGARFFVGELGAVLVILFMIAAHQYHIGNLINRVKDLERFQGQISKAHEYYTHPLGTQTFWHKKGNDDAANS